MRSITAKTNSARKFHYTKFSAIELVLTDRINLSGTRPKSACGKFFSCRFSSTAARNVITKATECVTFGFSFRTIVFFLFQESLNITVCKWYGFFTFLAAIIRLYYNLYDKQRIIHVRAWIRNSFRVGHTTMYYFVYHINTILVSTVKSVFHSYKIGLHRFLLQIRTLLFTYHVIWL